MNSPIKHSVTGRSTKEADLMRIRELEPIINDDVNDTLDFIVDDQNQTFKITMIQILTFLKNRLSSIFFDVGDVIITTNTLNPSVRGFGGTWIAIENDTTINFINPESSKVGDVAGDNEIKVPLPLHYHKFKNPETSSNGKHNHISSCEFDGEHSHDYDMLDTTKKWDLTSNNSPSDPDGQLVSLRTLNTKTEGKHNHNISISEVENHSHNINIEILEEGTKDAKINIQSKRINLIGFIRIK